MWYIVRRCNLYLYENAPSGRIFRIALLICIVIKLSYTIQYDANQNTIII